MLGFKLNHVILVHIHGVYCICYLTEAVDFVCLQCPAPVTATGVTGGGAGGCDTCLVTGVTRTGCGEGNNGVMVKLNVKWIWYNLNEGISVRRVRSSDFVAASPFYSRFNIFFKILDFYRTREQFYQKEQNNTNTHESTTQTKHGLESNTYESDDKYLDFA